ncbi:MAG: hypothetical protein SGJ02_09725 [bacterium]|nr:hypothetical protein [bacterium]
MKLWSNSSVSGNGGSLPEKRLLAAVLQRAVADYVGGEPELKSEAKLWLMTDEASDAPLTFHFICEALDLNVDSLRKAIERQAQTAYMAAGIAV